MNISTFSDSLNQMFDKVYGISTLYSYEEKDGVDLISVDMSSPLSSLAVQMLNSLMDSTQLSSYLVYGVKGSAAKTTYAFVPMIKRDYLRKAWRDTVGPVYRFVKSTVKLNRMGWTPVEFISTKPIDVDSISFGGLEHGQYKHDFSTDVYTVYVKSPTDNVSDDGDVRYEIRVPGITVPCVILKS